MRFPSLTLPIAAIILLTSLLLSPSSYSASAALKTRQLSAPTFPGVTFLYTLYADCLNTLYATQGPRGVRQAIPIVGGNFTGPKLNGKVLDLGADWGVTDIQTGIFSADTRYNLRTDDGANLWLQTSGPAQVDGSGLHLRVVIETGDKRYYWLNNVVAVGVLSQAGTFPGGFVLRIDVWHMTSVNANETKFINGTSYP